MRDTDLYQRILGLESPWKVARVELDVKQTRVDVYAEHSKRKTWPCPECDAPCGLHDHDEERAWRHLDSCQFKTILHARLPRVRCDIHGVLQVRVPWAEPRSRFTLLFEGFAIDVLWETDILGAARILDISWDEAHGIMERAVMRGLTRRKHKVPEHMGLDEKALAKGHRYATIVCDLDKAHVIDVAQDRTGESVVHCLERFSTAELAAYSARPDRVFRSYPIARSGGPDHPIGAKRRGTSGLSGCEWRSSSFSSRVREARSRRRCARDGRRWRRRWWGLRARRANFSMTVGT